MEPIKENLWFYIFMCIKLRDSPMQTNQESEYV